MRICLQYNGLQVYKSNLSSGETSGIGFVV